MPKAAFQAQARAGILKYREDRPSWFRPDFVGKWGDLCGSNKQEGEKDMYCNSSSGYGSTAGEAAVVVAGSRFLSRKNTIRDIANVPEEMREETDENFTKRMDQLKKDFFSVQTKRKEFVFVTHGGVMRHLSEAFPGDLEKMDIDGYKNNAIVKLVFGRQGENVPVLVSRILEYEGNVDRENAVTEVQKKVFNMLRPDVNDAPNPYLTYNDYRTVYVIRHGQSCANNTFRELVKRMGEVLHAPVDMTVFQDSYLTDNAQDLARTLLSTLKTNGKTALANTMKNLASKDAVYATPLKRTRQTAELIFGYGSNTSSGGGSKIVTDDHIFGWGFERRKTYSDVMKDSKYEAGGDCRTEKAASSDVEVADLKISEAVKLK